MLGSSNQNFRFVFSFESTGRFDGLPTVVAIYRLSQYADPYNRLRGFTESIQQWLGLIAFVQTVPDRRNKNYLRTEIHLLQAETKQVCNPFCEKCPPILKFSFPTRICKRYVHTGMIPCSVCFRFNYFSFISQNTMES